MLNKGMKEYIAMKNDENNLKMLKLKCRVWNKYEV